MPRELENAVRLSKPTAKMACEHDLAVIVLFEFGFVSISHEEVAFLWGVEELEAALCVGCDRVCGVGCVVEHCGFFVLEIDFDGYAC